MQFSPACDNIGIGSVSINLGRDNISAIYLARSNLTKLRAPDILIQWSKRLAHWFADNDHSYITFSDKSPTELLTRVAALATATS